MRKATKAEKERRINEVFDLLILGRSRHQILQYASRWQLTDRQIDSYIASANGMLSAEREFHRAREFGKAKVRLEQLLSTTWASKDYRTAVAILKELNDLLGLREPPPPATLKVIGVDPAQLAELVSVIQGAGMSPGDLFGAMIQELADAEK